MKQRPYRYTVRPYLTILIVAEIGAVTLIAAGLSSLLRRFWSFSWRLPEFVWLFLISIAVGAALTSFLGRWLFHPITKLGDAMREVAGGDFDVRLDEAQRLPEVKDIYQNFNRMVCELKSTEILQTNFVSNVSHEFKTPINAIEGYATLLQGCEQGSENQAEYVEKILFNTRRLSALVGNILLLSKADNAAIQTNQTDFRLDEQIRQSIVSLEPEWEKKGLAFDVDLESVSYYGQESMLLHVWNNLIGNAVKFSPDGGELRIRLIRSGGAVIFTVEDDGPGISEGDQQHIFDRFFQGDSSHKTEGNGHGLALVKQIVRLFGGEISVANTPPTGCRFTVSLPESAPPDGR